MKTIIVNSEKITILSISKIFSGYGHNKLTCSFRRESGADITHTLTTNNIRLTDRMSDCDSDVEEEAQLEAAELVVIDYLNSL